jgi:AcrR family transcriptional regulator
LPAFPREVAKRIGYSIGTIYNVMGSLDALMLAINGHTLDLWRAALEDRLAGQSENRLAQAIAAYFDFASHHRHAWTALYDFRLPENEAPPDYRPRHRHHRCRGARWPPPCPARRAAAALGALALGNGARSLLLRAQRHVPSAG